MKKAFAKLFDVHESEIDERDLPIVAMAGSGGGFRAMINTTGSLIGAKESGLLDCVTYISGISGMQALVLVSISLSDSAEGSCWALGALYSGVSGSYEPGDSAEHLIQRIQTSYVDASTLDLLTTPPTNKVRFTSPHETIALILSTYKVSAFWPLTEGKYTHRKCFTR